MGYLWIGPICFLVDQIGKMKAVSSMDDTTDIRILKDQIHLKLSYNQGAFLGFLRQKKGLLMALNIVSLVGLIGLTIYYSCLKGHMIMKIGLSFMTGGAMSNIWDRIKRKKVIDYFAFRWKPDLVFNLADMFVFIGAILIMISSWRQK